MSEKIVQAAGKLFARQGYRGTSTRDIAHLADVGEITIFRHFNNKEGLFWATLQAYSAELEFPRDLLDGLEHGEPPEVVLPRVLDLLADTVDYKPELIRLIAVALLELRWKADGYCQQRLSPPLLAINRYFEMSIKSGNIPDLDPTMLTSALVMMALTHPTIHKLIHSDKASYPNRLKAHRARSLFWLDILAPRALMLQLPASSQTTVTTR